MDIKLTDEEKVVMNLLAEGFTAAEIADWVGIDYEKFLKYKKNILKQLKVTRTTQILSALIKFELLK